MLEQLSFQIVGVAPLLMHNGRLADPLDDIVRQIKEVSSKRHKTDADHEEMARLEWLGSLYLHDGEPCIPADVLEAALIGRGGAARKQKMGKQAAAGLMIFDNAPLEYEGSHNPHEMWKLSEFRFRCRVKIGQSSVMRTRPIFRDWAANISIQYNPDIINADDVKLWMEIAGAEVGLMDWRPKYGRFESEVIETTP